MKELRCFYFFNLGYLGDRAELFKKREGSNLGKEKESQDWEGWETIRFYKEWGLGWPPHSTSEGKDLRWVLPVLPSTVVLRVKIGSSVASCLASCGSRRNEYSFGNCVDQGPGLLLTYRLLHFCAISLWVREGWQYCLTSMDFPSALIHTWGIKLDFIF